MEQSKEDALNYFLGFIGAKDSPVMRSIKDKVRDEICPEDFGVPSEHAEAARRYASCKRESALEAAAIVISEMTGNTSAAYVIRALKGKQ